MAAIRWAIVSGEYPPQPGGVADYTALLVRGLVEAGDTITVYTPRQGLESQLDVPGATVVELPDHFGTRGLLVLHRALARTPRPDRLLVQYVPHMYGYRGMNLPLCLWLRYACPVPPWVMFHEVAFPVVAGQPWKHRLLARMTGWMAALVSRSACQRFVSTPSWEPFLQQLAPGAAAATWLPVPSNVSTRPDPQTVARCRKRIQPGTGVILGHFGTFGHTIAEAVAAVLPPLLHADPQRTGLLIGRGSEVFANRLCRAHPRLAGQVRATGEVSAEEVAAHLAACDLLVQPYPDGADGRRTTLMAGLALGLPIVTTEGRHSEPLWRQSGAVEFVPMNEPDRLVGAAERLLRDPQARANLGKAARLVYEREFALQRTIERLRVGVQ